MKTQNPPSFPLIKSTDKSPASQSQRCTTYTFADKKAGRWKKKKQLTPTQSHVSIYVSLHFRTSRAPFGRDSTCPKRAVQRRFDARWSIPARKEKRAPDPWSFPFFDRVPRALKRGDRMAGRSRGPRPDPERQCSSSLVNRRDARSWSSFD